MKIKEITFIVLLIISLVGAVYLVRQNQESRRGAYFSSAKLMLQPSDRIEKKVGENVPVAIYFESPTGTKVDGVHTVLCYGPNIELPDTEIDSRIVVDTAAGFDATPVILKKEYDGKKCVNIVVTSKQDAGRLKDGMNKVASVSFSAVSVGEGDITIDQTRSKMTGDNPGQSDLSIEIGQVTNTTYKIMAADGGNDGGGNDGGGNDGGNTTERTFIYKIAYSGVRDGFDKCAQNWEVKLIALGGGTSKAYTDTPHKVGKKGDLTVYQGEVKISGLPDNNVAVFIKGKKSLQMKYGVDNQSSMYNKAGGELSLTDENTVHDFSGYPLLQGDIAGQNTENQDGVINGIDFSMVQSKVLSHESVAEGGYMKADLNGNCSMETKDTDTVRSSLNEKQGQLY